MPDISFNGKSSRYHYGLELDACYVSAPVRKSYPVDIPCGDAVIDMMQGEPVYEQRSMTMEFTIAEIHAQDTAPRLLAELVGRTVDMITPDNPFYFWTGTVRLASAGRSRGDAVVLEAQVFPWRRSNYPTVHEYKASEAQTPFVWRNAGSRVVVPRITVTGGPATITARGITKTVDPGTYLFSEFKILGQSTLDGVLSGGVIHAEYREAIL